MPELEVVFVNGRVVDGTGTPPFRADVGIAEGRIQCLGRISNGSARRVVDIRGLLLAPGFVDMHSHSDVHLLFSPQAEAKVMQGVTTEVIGQDGLSFAPVDERTLAAVREQTLSWHGAHAEVTWDWSTVAEYLSRFDRHTSVNVAYLVPHGTIRILVMGHENRAPTADELSKMKHHVRQGMIDGAVGLSTGLSYSPAMFANEDELTTLCHETAAFGGFFAPHHRNYGSRVLESYLEMVGIARQARVPLHLTHCVMHFPVNAGRAHELIEMLEGVDPNEVEVTADGYPYSAASTYLSSILPDWVSGRETDGILAVLRDDRQATRIRHTLEVEGSSGYHGIPVDWSAIEVSGLGSDGGQRWVGMRIPEIAAAMKIEPFEAARRLLLQERLNVNVILHIGNEDNVREMMKQPYYMAGTDGILAGDRPHPRGWGTCARFLGHYARDEGLFSWEGIVQKMTSLPHRRLGQWDRGLIRPGMWADLTVFAPLSVRDTATYEEPRSFPEGIPYVMVNGVLVKDEGVHTGALPGHVLRLSGFR